MLGVGGCGGGWDCSISAFRISGLNKTCGGNREAEAEGRGCVERGRGGGRKKACVRGGVFMVAANLMFFIFNFLFFVTPTCRSPVCFSHQ